MIINDFGRIAYDEWLNTFQIRSNVELDKFVVMPNHIHGIMIINCRGVWPYAPTLGLQYNRGMGISQCHPTAEFRSPSQTIGAIVRGYKSAVTKKINTLRNTPKMPFWQRAYYEHVIRNEDDLNQVREYIINNPLKWELDRENPSNIEKRK
jgi:REP element-mobilizing transposase RayT